LLSMIFGIDFLKHAKHAINGPSAFVSKLTLTKHDGACGLTPTSKCAFYQWLCTTIRDTLISMKRCAKLATILVASLCFAQTARDYYNEIYAAGGLDRVPPATLVSMTIRT
jgi:hypothetical protein